MKKWTKWVEDKNSSRWWVYPPNCRTKVGARWSPSFPRQSLARRRARNIVQVHAHALNGSWECYHVVRIGLGAIWGDHGRRRSLHFWWVYPLCPLPFDICVSCCDNSVLFPGDPTLAPVTRRALAVCVLGVGCAARNSRPAEPAVCCWGRASWCI